MRGGFILDRLTTVFTMEKTLGNIYNKDWIRQCGIIFITLIFQVEHIFCEGYGTTEDPNMCQNPQNPNILIPYDPFREICCAGKVFDNSFHEYSCHRGNIYLHYEEFFCGDQKLKIQGNKACCGQEVYNPAEFSCCNDKLKTKEENMVCCGREMINSTEKKCCLGNRIVNGHGECCGWSDTLYNPETQVCIGDVVYEMPFDGDPLSSYGVCDGRLYDTEKKICCDGNLSEKQGNMECKWGQLYDASETTVNIRRKVQDIEDGKTKLCGPKMYNPNVEVCCDSSPFKTVRYVGSANGACCGGEAYSKDSASCCRGVITEGIPEIPGIQACSGNVSYLNSGNISCSLGSVSARYSNDEVDCCGGELYFLNESVCCMGKIRDKLETGVCCGTNVLRPNQHCINDEIVPGGDGDDKLCEQYPTTINGYIQRPSRVIPYNSALFICKKGALVVKKPNMAYCAGSGQIYNREKEICCGNYRVFSKENEWGWKRRCCGYESYHPNVQSCFHTHIYHFPEKYSDRCYTSLFDTRSHVCIDNRIFAKYVTHLTEANCRDAVSLSAFGQSCCQGKPINDSTHLCCNNRIYSKDGMEDADCCSGRVYDKASPQYLCCDDRLHRTGGVSKTCVGRLAVAEYEKVCGNMVYNKTEGSCCGNGLHNPDTHLCCDNVRIERESESETCCGTRKYDTSEFKVCCDGALHEQRDGFKCCGSSLINPDDDICINDQYVIDRRYEELTCNSSITGDPTGTCCAGIKHVQKFGSCDGVYLIEGSDSHGGALWEDAEENNENSEEELLQCGDESYNVATETCCNGKVITNGIKICCQGKIRKVTELGENSCCGTKAYNNDSTICCGRQTKEKSGIQSKEDAEGCCENGKFYDLESRQCQERVQEEEEEEATEESGVCSLCRKSNRRRKEISDLACGAMHHLSIRVTRTKKKTLFVKVSPLKCKTCPTSLTKREMKKLKQLLLPEGCDCEFADGKYVLLSSGQLREDGHLPLQRSDALLPYKTAKIIRDVFENRLC